MGFNGLGAVGFPTPPTHAGGAPDTRGRCPPIHAGPASHVPAADVARGARNVSGRPSVKRFIA
jgi:hypothetical protein